MVCALIVGHSHIHAIQSAAKEQSADWLEFYSLRGKRPYPLVTDQCTLHPKLVDDINRVARHTDPLFLSLHGNHHFAFGIANHPVPFDFVLKDRDDLPIVKGIQVVPYAVVRESLRALIKVPLLDTIGAFRRQYRGRLFFLESPPPVSSNEHIARHPAALQALIKEHGVAPAVHRYKLWRLHSLLVKEVCEACGIGFLSVPPESMDSAGFLVEHAWNPDPTHANVQYGHMVIESIKRLV